MILVQMNIVLKAIDMKNIPVPLWRIFNPAGMSIRICNPQP